MIIDSKPLKSGLYKILRSVMIIPLTVTVRINVKLTMRCMG